MSADPKSKKTICLDSVKMGEQKRLRDVTAHLRERARQLIAARSSANRFDRSARYLLAECYEMIAEELERLFMNQ